MPYQAKPWLVFTGVVLMEISEVHRKVQWELEESVSMYYNHTHLECNVMAVQTKQNISVVLFFKPGMHKSEKIPIQSIGGPGIDGVKGPTYDLWIISTL